MVYRCTKDIQGVNQKGYCQSGQQCALDDDGLPEKDCKFCVNERSNTAKGSLMGKPEISSVGETGSYIHTPPCTTRTTFLHFKVPASQNKLLSKI